MVKAYLVLRMKGQVNIPYWAKTTLKLLRLDKKFRATIIPVKENTEGMLDKVKHYVSWQEPDISLIKELLEKKGRKEGYKSITPEDLSQLGFKSIEDLAKLLVEGKSSLSKLKPLKPWFALSPPRHGFKRNTKKLYGEGGMLGHNKDLAAHIKNMI